MGLDRANPLAVRLIRQHLRSAGLVVSFCLLLVVGLTTIAGAPLVAPLLGLQTGRALFLLIVAWWSLMAWVIHPSQLLQQFDQERRDGTWLLIELTALPPVRVIRGYVWAGAVQQILYASAMAPFLMLTWILYGVDLLLLLTTLAVIPCLGVFCLITAVQTGTTPGMRKRNSPRLRLAGIGQWIVLIPLTWWMVFSRLDTWLSEGLAAGDPRLWAMLLFVGNAWLLGVTTSLVHAGTNLMHPAMDRDSPRRGMVMILVLNSLPWLSVAAWLGPSAGWAFCWWSVMIMGRALMAIPEPCRPLVHTPRQAATWNNSNGWRRWLRRVLAPDGAAGRNFFVLLCAMAVAGASVGLALAPMGSLEGKMAAGVLGVAAYTCWFLVLGDHMTRRVFGRDHAGRLMLLMTVLLIVATGVFGYTCLVLEADNPWLWPLDWVGGLKAAGGWSATRADLHPGLAVIGVLGVASAIVLLRHGRRPVSIVRRYARETDAVLG